MQIYRYFDIGTAKPSLEDRKSVRHHLIDIINPDEEYSAGRFKKDAEEIICKLHSQGKIPIIAGGTGLYINALTKGMSMAVASDPSLRNKLQKRSQQKGHLAMYNELVKVDPKAAEKIKPADIFRIERALEVYYLTGKPMSSFQFPAYKEKIQYDLLYIILNLDRPLLYQLINNRVDTMISEGLLEEVKAIIGRGFSDQLKPFQSIGYKQIVKYLRKEFALEEAVESIKKETRNFAKRQLTWFRKVHTAKWIEVDLKNPESTREEVYKTVQEHFFTG